jgi:hypothetical protein
MKEITFLILLFVLACLAHDSAAVSPMPVEELKPGQTAITCAIHIAYMPEREKMTPGEVYSKTLFFEASAPKRDVLAEMTRYIDNRLNTGSVTEFRLECKFPK